MVFLGAKSSPKLECLKWDHSAAIRRGIQPLQIPSHIQHPSPKLTLGPSLHEILCHVSCLKKIPRWPGPCPALSFGERKSGLPLHSVRDSLFRAPHCFQQSQSRAFRTQQQRSCLELCPWLLWASSFLGEHSWNGREEEINPRKAGRASDQGFVS